MLHVPCFLSGDTASVVKTLQSRGACRKDMDVGYDGETFTVQLQKGPRGLGLGLIDGMVNRVFEWTFYSQKATELQQESTQSVVAR